MIHFDIQFSYTDLFILKKYLQFFFNEINESCENYIKSYIKHVFKNRFEWSTWLFETKKPKCILINININIA